MYWLIIEQKQLCVYLTAHGRLADIAWWKLKQKIIRKKYVISLEKSTWFYNMNEIDMNEQIDIIIINEHELYDFAKCSWFTYDLLRAQNGIEPQVSIINFWGINKVQFLGKINNLTIPIAITLHTEPPQFSH
jgi:hypothetical protein